jgi:translation initiation factor 1
VGKPKPPPPPAVPAGPFHAPFARLAGRLGDLPPGPEPVSTAPEVPRPSAPARAVVRMERAGRGGKTVTVVEQLGLPAPELAAWLKALKGELGCGGAVEGEALVLQGDLRERVRAALAARGVMRVSVG